MLPSNPGLVEIRWPGLVVLGPPHFEAEHRPVWDANIYIHVYLHIYQRAMPVSLIYLEIKCLYSYLKGCSSVVEKYDVHLQLMFVPRPRVGPGPLYTGADLFLHDSVIKIILCRSKDLYRVQNLLIPHSPPPSSFKKTGA